MVQQTLKSYTEYKTIQAKDNPKQLEKLKFERASKGLPMSLKQTDRIIFKKILGDLFYEKINEILDNGNACSSSCDITIGGGRIYFKFLNNL